MTGFSTDPERRISRRTALRGLAGLGAACLLPSFPRLARTAEAAETSRAWRCMGTLIEVRVPDLPAKDAVAGIRRVRRRLEELEAAWTLYRPESPLVALNRAGEDEWVPVPADLVAGLEAAVQAFRATEGRFDPTVGPVLRAWGLFDREGRPADRAVLRRWRSRPGLDAIELDAGNRRARRGDRRVEMDLGGIGKGMAVDAALQELGAAGSGSALVNLGGSIGVLGPPPHREAGWPVGIAHPRRAGETWTELGLAEGHLATSGDSERWVETPQGKKHHLIDPRSGDPVTGIASLTRWASTGIEADVSSTAGFVAEGRTSSPSTTVVIADLPGERRRIRIDS